MSSFFLVKVVRDGDVWNSSTCRALRFHDRIADDEVGERCRAGQARHRMPRRFSAAAYLAALDMCSAYVRAKLCVPLKSSFAHMYR